MGVQLDSTNAGKLEASIQSIQDSKLRKLVSVIVLKTLQAPKYFCSGSVDIAKYSHYALNVPLFTHFTAPSRRFADIIVHRQLEASLSPGGMLTIMSYFVCYTTLIPCFVYKK